MIVKYTLAEKGAFVMKKISMNNDVTKATLENVFELFIMRKKAINLSEQSLVYYRNCFAYRNRWTISDSSANVLTYKTAGRSDSRTKYLMSPSPGSYTNTRRMVSSPFVLLPPGRLYVILDAASCGAV